MSRKYLHTLAILLLVNACSADKPEQIEASSNKAIKVESQNISELKLDDILPKLNNLLVNNDHQNNKLDSYYLGQSISDIPCTPNYYFSDTFGKPQDKILSCDVNHKNSNTSFRFEFGDNKVMNVKAYVSVNAPTSNYDTFRNLITSKYGEPGNEIVDFKSSHKYGTPGNDMAAFESSSHLGYNLSFTGIDGPNKNLTVHIIDCNRYKTIQDRKGVDRYPSGKCDSSSKATHLLIYNLADINGDQYVALSESEYNERAKQLGLLSSENSEALEFQKLYGLGAKAIESTSIPDIQSTACQNYTPKCSSDPISFNSCRMNINSFKEFVNIIDMPQSQQQTNLLNAMQDTETEPSTRDFMASINVAYALDKQGAKSYVDSGLAFADCFMLRTGNSSKTESYMQTYLKSQNR